MAWFKTSLLSLATGETKAYLTDVTPRDIGSISIHDALLIEGADETQPLEILSTELDGTTGQNVLNLAKPYLGTTVSGATAVVMPIAGAFKEAAQKLNDLHDMYIGASGSAISASLTQQGVVQLNDSTTSTSITQAATPNAIKKLSEQPLGGGTF